LVLEKQGRQRGDPIEVERSDRIWGTGPKLRFSSNCISVLSKKGRGKGCA